MSFYLPGFRAGGPIRTIANMVERLSGEFDFKIVTADRDGLDVAPYSDVDINNWNKVGHAQVWYAGRDKRGVRDIARLVRETPHDVLYLNSFFDPVFTLRPLVARRLNLLPRQPCVVAARGEFSAGALALKGWKKWPYIALARASGLYKDVVWQASSEHEALDIQRVIHPEPEYIKIVPNLPRLAGTNVGAERGELYAHKSLKICFLSRIAPKKNLAFALRVLNAVSAPVEFNIYGPVWDEAYWRQCQSLVEILPRHIVVRYHGNVSPDAVGDVMQAHDLFFLPTCGENFGHVILEALSVGVPVLISDKTPWAADDAGGCKVCSLQALHGFVDAIESIAAMSLEERMRLRSAAGAVARKFNDSETLLEQNLTLFRELCDASAPVMI